MEIAAIIREVRQKKQLAYVDDEIVTEKIQEFLQKNQKIDIEKLSDRSSDFKSIVKYVRQQLHDIYTVFQTSRTAKREKYLAKLKKAVKKIKRDDILDLREKILESHLSSRERLDTYKEIYHKIFTITGHPKRIVDLGAGLNAFSIGFMGLQDLEYTAIELSQADCDFINEYFKILQERSDRIKGSAKKIDLEKVDDTTLRSLSCDICFAFKLFDLLDNKTTERIITTLPCKWFAISFSKITVGRHKMRQIRRAGFQKMMRRLNLQYKTFETDNELFYIIEKLK